MWDLLSRQALWISGGGPQPSRRSQRRLARQRGHKLLVCAEVISTGHHAPATDHPTACTNQRPRPATSAQRWSGGEGIALVCLRRRQAHSPSNHFSGLLERTYSTLQLFMGFYSNGFFFFLNDLTNLENINPACQVSWFHQRDLQNVVQTSNTNNLICSSLTI